MSTFKGSNYLQCTPEGKCDCKPGVVGEKCDQCAANHWNFNTKGCESCECKPEGSLNNTPSCDPATGDCLCKQNVVGKRCDNCEVGHFYIDANNEFGCTQCFCFGHTSDCELSGGYVKSRFDSKGFLKQICKHMFSISESIMSDFSRSKQDWEGYEDGETSEVRHDVVAKTIAIQSIPNAGAANPSNGAYFLAPSK